MEKPAQIFLKFNKAEDGGVWSALVGIAKKKTVLQDTEDGMIATILVKSYSLADGQFIEIKLNTDDGRERVFLIPRSIVVGILEGKSDLAKSLYFAGGTSKS